MSARKHWLLIVAALLSLVTAACTNDALDDSGAPDVILEAGTLDNPPVTATLDLLGCTFTVETWSIAFRNEAANPIAGSPFNDVVMDSVQVSYFWFEAPPMSTRVFGLTGTIPTNSEQSIEFPPIALDDLSLAYASSTANVVLLFTAHTVEGTTIRVQTSGVLNVNACTS